VGCGLAVAAALACARPDARAAGSSAPPIVIATTVDLGGVNPLVATGTRFSHEVLDLLFRELLAERADRLGESPGFAPALAESWDLSTDRHRLLLRLRDGLRWSDGAPITAHDVVFTHRAELDDAVAWSYSDSKRSIEDVAALDDRTVLFRFHDGGAFPLVDVNDGAILPEHAWSALPFAEWRRGGEWFREHLVTSGPFRLAAWRPGVELALAPDPGFAGPGPLPAGPVVFRVVPDPAALVEQLLSGAFDFADGLTPLDAARVEATAGLRLVVGEARQYDYIAWNLRRAPFDDPEVRRALTQAIDRQLLVDTLWRGRARVAAGPVPAPFWARDPDLAPWPFDPAAARRRLAERGFADRDGDGVVERDGHPFRFELLTNAGNRVRSDALVLIQEQLRRVGVDVVPRTLEIQALTDRNLSGDYDATLAGWAVDTTLDFRPYFHSREIADGWNFVGYASAEADRLLDAAAAAESPATMLPHLLALQRLLHREQPYTFLWEPPRLAAVRRNLSGVEISPLSALAGLPRWRRLAGES
jgi:peptide/nickel transport system substrate-binding protein